MFINSKWVYKDNGDDATIDRMCARCGKMPTIEGYDACLGHLDNVESACCGHGATKPYIVSRSADAT